MLSVYYFIELFDILFCLRSTLFCFMSVTKLWNMSSKGVHETGYSWWRTCSNIVLSGKSRAKIENICWSVNQLLYNIPVKEKRALFFISTAKAATSVLFPPTLINLMLKQIYLLERNPLLSCFDPSYARCSCVCSFFIYILILFGQIGYSFCHHRHHFFSFFPFRFDLPFEYCIAAFQFKSKSHWKRENVSVIFELQNGGYGVLIQRDIFKFIRLKYEYRCFRWIMKHFKNMFQQILFWTVNHIDSTRGLGEKTKKPKQMQIFRWYFHTVFIILVFIYTSLLLRC